jgi:hypothetical protein
MIDLICKSSNIIHQNKRIDKSGDFIIDLGFKDI